MAAETALHASCVLVGERGVLIRGPSGSGKSHLAWDLIHEMAGSGRFARLVGDDRLRVVACNGRVIATAVPAIAGMLELRGAGVLTIPYENAAIVRLVVDCLAEPPPRLPSPRDQTVSVCGVSLPRIGTRIEPGLSRLILWRLDHPGDVLMTDP